MKRNACSQQAPDLNRKIGSLWDRARAVALVRAFIMLILVSVGSALLPAAVWAQGASQQQAAWRATSDPVFNAATAQFQRGAGAGDPVSITVMLKLNNKAGLDDLVRRQRTRGDPAYHQWLSHAQSTQQFGPSQTQAQAVADYLQNNGFTNVKIASDNLLVTATGTATLAQIAFNTQIGVFLNDNGETGLANMSAIQVPSALSQVDRVLGLNTITRLHVRPPASVVKLSTAAAAGSGGASGYYPDQFSTVYNRPPNQTASNTTVAIVGWGDMNGPISDLQAFETARGLPQVPAVVCLFNISSSSAPCTSPSASTQGSYTDDQREWSMDGQAIVGISGGVKQLRFYTASSDESGDTTGGVMLSTLHQIVTDNVAKVISMSWATAECVDSSAPYDTIFELGVTQGQTFAAGSGDSGAYSYYCGGIVVGSITPRISVNYPASSPYVVAVGGTTLTTNGALGYGSESAWPYSGGGVSIVEPIPLWQSSSGLSGSYRQVPDVAFDADNVNSPIIYYLNGSWVPGGGTSLATPLFAGAWAVLESVSNNALDFAAPLLYSNVSQLYASSALHDVTTGSNGTLFLPPNSSAMVTYPGYKAGPGYDNVTGLGSFDIAKMLAFFTSQSTYTVTISSSSSAGGTINPSGTISGVVSGTAKAIIINPSVGYAPSVGGTCGGALSLNPQSSASSSVVYTYTTKAITANCTVTVAFAPQTYTITASSSPSAGGTISPSGTIGGVTAGTSKSFTITANPGYAISTSSNGTCGGSAQTSGSPITQETFTIKPITANCTVTATFLSTYTITASAGANGSISPSGSITGVVSGTTKTFTVTPNSGYAISSVGGTCGGTLKGSAYTTNAIAANCTVTATFLPLLTVTASASTGGTISPSGTISGVVPGTNLTFMVTANPGYYLSIVNGTCGYGGSSNWGESFSTKPITANCTVTVVFLPFVIITASAGTGGTINPSGNISSLPGRPQGFTLTPNSGYAVSSVGGTCNGTFDGNTNTYTVTATTNCIITAAFAKAYTVTASAGTGGIIEPTGNIGVAPGTSRTFIIAPDSGYVTTSIGGSCGGTLSGNTYTTKAITGNCTVTAAFAKAYTVTASAGTGGTISPAGSISVASGTSRTFTITPNSGYVTTSAGGTCGGSLSGTTYTTKAITSNCTVTASFTPVYTITASAGTGGTISPTGASTANAGTTKAFTVKPNSGYATTSVGGTCGGTLNGTTHTTNAITANCTVTAAFTQIFTVTASAGSGGTISPSGSIGSVPVGTVKAFTVTPGSGYVLSSVGGTCGGTLNGSTYTTSAITANCTVTAAFLHTYTVTASAGTGGSISPSGAIGNIVSGTAKTFTVTPNAGYVTSSVGGNCGGTLSGNTYTTKAITGNCTVTAAFTPIYTITASAGTGGAISPSGAISGVVSGTTRAFTITTNAGYTAPAVGGTCGGSLSSTTYTTKAITSNCTVAVSFTPVYTITASAGTGGTISPAGSTTVNAGTTKAFTVKPNSGYITTSVGGTCGGTLNGTTYTTSAINANCTVTAAFTQIFTVTASAGSGGSISPSGSIGSVLNGTTKIFTLTPSSGYVLSSVGGTCSGTLNGNTYTTKTITANCTVTAAFAKPYTITASAGTGGTISPSGSISVAPGATKTFTLTTNSGYTAPAVGGTCGGTLSGNTYTTNAITGNCTVAAWFTQMVTVTASAGAGGTISPSGNVSLVPGSNRAFTLTPNPGYVISSVGGTCNGVRNGNVFTAQLVYSNCSVTAVFATQ